MKTTKQQIANNASLTKDKGNFLAQVSNHVALAFRLMFDDRISIWTKAAPFVLYVFYFLTIDWVLWGPIDDVGVIILAYFVFLRLCPPSIVKELIK